MKHPTLTDNAKVIYAGLALHRNQRFRKCNPSQATLSDELTKSVRTIARGLHELEEAGAIVVDYVEGCGTHYTLIHLDQEEGRTPVKSDRSTPDKSGRTPPANLSGTPDNPGTLPPHPPIRNRTDEEQTNLTEDWDSISLSLVQEWNKRFPQTVFGANQLIDQNDLRELLASGQKTEADIRGYMDYLDKSGDIQYWPRPHNLCGKSDQRNGPYVWARIDLKVEMADRKVEPGKSAATSSPWTRPEPPTLSPLPDFDLTLRPVLDHVEKKIRPASWRVWFWHREQWAVSLTREGSGLILWTHTPEAAGYIDSHYRDALQEAATDLRLGDHVIVRPVQVEQKEAMSA